MHPEELAEMKKRELDEKRKRRIEAGVEVVTAEDCSDMLVGGGGVLLAMHSLNDDGDDDDGLDVLMPSVRDIIDDTHQLMD